VLPLKIKRKIAPTFGKILKKEMRYVDFKVVNIDLKKTLEVGNFKCLT
jgi:hypothetical protein